MQRFLILGGDPRQLCLARYLKQAGHDVSLYYEASSPSFSLKEAMEDSHIILCPIPFTKDGKTIFSHNRLPGLELDAFMDSLKPGHVLFGGNVPAAVTEHCKANRIPCFDFMKMEEVACKNAVATAEGAVAEAISLSPMNLRGSSCLVIGWGRCGQTLAGTLKAMGANTAVAGRNRTKLAQVHCHGHEAVPLEQLSSHIQTYDFIFNTVPAMILDASLAGNVKQDAAVIDIASAPGGVDFEALRQAGIRAKLCPGLPGIYSPMTSARILYEAVTEHLQERSLLWN